MHYIFYGMDDAHDKYDVVCIGDNVIMWYPLVLYIWDG